MSGTTTLTKTRANNRQTLRTNPPTPLTVAHAKKKGAPVEFANGENELGGVAMLVAGPNCVNQPEAERSQGEDGQHLERHNSGV